MFPIVGAMTEKSDTEFKEKHRKNILAVKASGLFSKFPVFEGFVPINRHDFRPEILENGVWARRDDLESNFDYKQPIVYSIIRCTNTDRFLTYLRSSDSKQYDESRLLGKLSVGAGGHIDYEDINAINNDYPDVLSVSAYKELLQEFDINLKDRRNCIEYVGFVHTQCDEVNSVHFGVVAIVNIEDEDLIKINSEAQGCVFKTADEMLNMLKDEKISTEPWTRIVANTYISEFC